MSRTKSAVPPAVASAMQDRASRRAPRRSGWIRRIAVADDPGVAPRTPRGPAPGPLGPNSSNVFCRTASASSRSSADEDQRDEPHRGLAATDEALLADRADAEPESPPGR